MEIQFFAATDVGRQRDHNEDNFLVDPKLQLFVVADGMGGHAAGEVASQITVHELSRGVRDEAAVIEQYGRAEDAAAARQAILTVLENAIQRASAAVFRAAQEDPEKRGMGTTASALLLAGDRGFIAHVGDSRIYLVRQGQVHQITEDHSLVNELVRRGKLKRHEIDSSPYAKYKNAVTRAVGANESVDADTLDFDVLPGDRFLLCSDGLHFYLRDGELGRLLDHGEVAEAPRRLVELANAGGGHDNITAVVVRIADEAARGPSQRASDLSNRVEVLKSMPLFRHLTYKEIMFLLNVTSVREVAPGETILVEGTPGEELFVVLAGRVRLHKGETRITTFERGAHFGEMALVDRAPRSASATAETSAKLLTLRRDEFYQIIRTHPTLANKMLWAFVQVLTERLRKTTADLSGMKLEAAAPEELEDLSDDALFEDD